MLEIAGSADAAVVNLFDACVATLLDDFCRKINLVMRRANAGAQLRNQFTGFNSKPCRIDSIAS